MERQVEEVELRKISVEQKELVDDKVDECD